MVRLGSSVVCVSTVRTKLTPTETISCGSMCFTIVKAGTCNGNYKAEIEDPTTVIDHNLFNMTRERQAVKCLSCLNVTPAELIRRQSEKASR